VVTEKGQRQIDTESSEENSGDLFVQGIMKDGSGGGSLYFFSHAGRLAGCSWLKRWQELVSKIFLHDFVYQKQEKKAIIPYRRSPLLRVCGDNEDG
jgi:hypothetical protein